MPVEPNNSPDFALLCAVHQRCFTPGWSEQAFLDLFLISGTEAFIAPDKEGFGILRIIAAEAEILTLAVLPECQRRGIGREIIGSMLEYARGQGVKSIFLEVRESNRAARRLYQAFGFSVISRRRNYYQSPHGVLEDAVVMRKSWHRDCNKTVI